MHIITEFDQDYFLATYWQKQPVLIKGMFKDFQDPIEPDELAGLAAEEDIESRLITRTDEQWHVEHGPFEDYEKYGEQGWTLLVQAVDHWWEAGSDFVDLFRFIPNWRIDDLMVSFSTPEGGVGPHLDQYDVFITQGLGKRHWRVGKKQAVEDKIPHPDLLQIHSFEACIDEILEPGDVLYIPPGCPHEGYAIENALNYSVGFRAPNQQDFLSSFADYALAEECFKQRYSDSEYRFRDDLATLQINEINKIRELITDCVNDPLHFDTWLGQYLSSAKHDLDIHEPDPALIIEDMQAMLEQINSWRKLGGLRTLIISDRLFINGERWSTSDDMCSFIHYLANTNHYDSLSLKKHTKNLKNLELLTKMVNQGYIYSTENL